MLRIVLLIEEILRCEWWFQCPFVRVRKIVRLAVWIGSMHLSPAGWRVDFLKVRGLSRGDSLVIDIRGTRINWF